MWWEATQEGKYNRRKQALKNLSSRIRGKSLTHIRMITLIHPVCTRRSKYRWWLSYLPLTGIKEVEMEPVFHFITVRLGCTLADPICPNLYKGRMLSPSIGILDPPPFGTSISFTLGSKVSKLLMSVSEWLASVTKSLAIFSLHYRHWLSKKPLDKFKNFLQNLKTNYKVILVIIFIPIDVVLCVSVGFLSENKSVTL